MRTYYPTRPAACVKEKFFVLIRIDIKEEISSEEEEIKQYSAEEIKVYAPYSQNKIFETFMTEKFGNDFENKLINEYNSAALLDVYAEDEKQSKIERYKEFLTQRKALKTEIVTICKENGIQ